MKQVFSYNKFNDVVPDTLVETFNMLVNKSIEHKNDTAEYKDANAKFNTAFMKYCVEAIPNGKFESLDDIKNPMVHRDMFFLQRFNTILAQAITPAVPTVVANGYSQLYDVTQVGWGDSAKYYVNSNELFIVNSVAEGIARGGVQTIAANEYTVQAHRKQISIYADWYQVAAGKLDWGYFGQKIGGVGLLEQSVAFIFLILEDSLDGFRAPVLIAGGGWNSHALQSFLYGTQAIAI